MIGGAMSIRRRRDGQPTVEEMARHRQAADDSVDDLVTILPPGDGPALAGAVTARQAEAAVDSAPPIGIGSDDRANRMARYEYIHEKFDRLTAIKAEQKTLREEASEIVQDLEKERGVNRGALSEVRKLFGLNAAAIKSREESRTELFDLLIKPKLDEAAAGQADE